MPHDQLSKACHALGFAPRTIIQATRPNSNADKGLLKKPTSFEGDRRASLQNTPSTSLFAGTRRSAGRCASHRAQLTVCGYHDPGVNSLN